MSVATDILAEAFEDADWRNAEVIQKAFRSRGLRCPHCDYPQNALDFEQLLRQYANTRVAEHYHSVRYDPPYWREHTALSVHGPLLYEAQRNANTLRQLLHSIWPCEHCTKRFNPTARQRRSFKFLPKRFPTNVAKEFLDD
jgi:hypothetical protein